MNVDDPLTFLSPKTQVNKMLEGTVENLQWQQANRIYQCVVHVTVEMSKHLRIVFIPVSCIVVITQVWTKFELRFTLTQKTNKTSTTFCLWSLQLVQNPISRKAYKPQGPDNNPEKVLQKVIFTNTVYQRWLGLCTPKRFGERL